MHQRRRTRARQAVVRGHVDIHHAEQIVGTHQVVLCVPREVTQIQQTETAERPDHYAHGKNIIAGVLWVRVEITAERNVGQAAGEWFRDLRAYAGYHLDVQASS